MADSSDSDSDTQVALPTKTAKAVKPVTPAPKKTPAKAPPVEESSSEEEEEAPKPAAKPAAKTPAKTPAKAQPVKTPAKPTPMDEESSDEEEPAQPPPKAKPTPAKPTPKAQAPPAEEEDDDDEEEEEEEEPAQAAPAVGNKRKAGNGAAAAQPKKQKTEENGEDVGNKVFVKGLAWSATEDDIKEFFGECGTITTVDIPVWDDGKVKGVAYVTFEDSDGAAKALEKDGESILGRWVNILPANKKPERGNREPGEKPEGCKEVFVGGLSWDTDEEGLKAHFSECGSIANTRIVYDRDTGNSKGFGYVEFEDESGVDEAIKLTGSSLGDRTIRVDYAGQKTGGGGGGKGGKGKGGKGKGGKGKGGKGKGGKGKGGKGKGGSKRDGIKEFAGSRKTFD